MVLTVKQRGELNNAIYEYLTNNDFTETASVFELETEVIQKVRSTFRSRTI